MQSNSEIIFSLTESEPVCQTSLYNVQAVFLLILVTLVTETPKTEAHCWALFMVLNRDHIINGSAAFSGDKYRKWHIHNSFFKCCWVEQTNKINQIQKWCIMLCYHIYTWKSDLVLFFTDLCKTSTDFNNMWCATSRGNVLQELTLPISP